jgi:hypothetical protein
MQIVSSIFACDSDKFGWATKNHLIPKIQLNLYGIEIFIDIPSSEGNHI